VFGRSKKIRDSLTKTRHSSFGQIAACSRRSDHRRAVGRAEALLVQADVGVNTTIMLVDRLRQGVAQGRARTAQAVEEMLKESCGRCWAPPTDGDRRAPAADGDVDRGVNGSARQRPSPSWPNTTASGTASDAGRGRHLSCGSDRSAQAGASVPRCRSSPPLVPIPAQWSMIASGPAAAATPTC